MEVIQDRGCSTDLQYKGQAYRLKEAVQDKGRSTDLQYKCQTYRIKEAVQDKGRSTDLQYKCQTYRIKEAVQAGCYKSLSLPQQKSLGSLSGVSVWGLCLKLGLSDSSLPAVSLKLSLSEAYSLCFKYAVSV